jgi:hypothetical protein
MSVYDVPGSADWLTRRIDLRTENRIRRQLRRLEREADARLVLVWIVGQQEIVIAYSGDYAAVPHPLPSLETTVPAHDDVTLVGGEREHAVTHQVIVGRAIAKMAIAIIAPGVTNSTTLFDMIADTTERVEEIVVEAITSAR